MPTVAPLDLDGHCVAAAFLGETPVFALADGTVHLLSGGHRVAEANDGLLAATVDRAGSALLCGGEDGRLTRVDAQGTVAELASAGRRWIPAIAAGPRGAAGYATGRTAHVRLDDGTMKEFRRGPDGRGPRLRAEGPANCARPLQRRRTALDFHERAARRA